MAAALPLMLLVTVTIGGVGMVIGAVTLPGRIGTLVANTAVRAGLSTLLGKNVGAAPVAVTGLSNGAGAAGELHLFIDFVIEDYGVAYKLTAAV